MKTGSYRITPRQDRDQLARGLGWFSLGLGLMEVLAPRVLSRLIGIAPRPRLMQALGVREIATGIGLLTQPDPAPWVKARVAGDAIDLALMGGSFLSGNSGKVRLTLAAAAVAGVTALDYLCGQDYSEGPGAKAARYSKSEPVKGRGASHVRRSIIVNRPPKELYEAWHNFEKLPRFMNHLIAVRVESAKRSHWVAKGPAGSRVEWDAELSDDRPNELIAWRSLENADVESSGSVRFEQAPGGRGTIVRVEIDYRPPAGRAGAGIAKLLGEAPEKQIAVDLMRFKQMVETGEIARTEGQAAGRSRSTSRVYDDLVRT